MKKIKEEVWYNRRSDEVFLFTMENVAYLDEDKEWVKVCKL